MEEVLKTRNGYVRGVSCDGILQFRDIPYAKPPVGDLRFRLPEPAGPWEGEYDARRRRAVAPQGASDLDLPMGPVLLPRNEDCLTLSVCTPSLEGKLPVAVWFHGGTNCYGGGNLEWYDGMRLAKTGNIVVVNLNFRLGPLGFFHYPGVNEHNLSIEDQMLALRWVKENIGDFGGDAGKVTLFGQSAGANAIVHIMSRPDSQGLFRQILLQSPSLGRGNHLREDAFEIGRNLLGNLGIPLGDGDAIHARLKDLQAEEILQAAGKIDAKLVAKHQGMLFKPVMDFWHTPDETVQAAAEAAAVRGIRILLGTAKEEMFAFITGRDKESVAEAERIQRMRYGLPAQKFACLAAEGGCQVWKYQFAWKAPKSKYGACHCQELPFVFGNLEAWDAPMLEGASQEEMQRLVSAMQGAWGRFFQFGDMEDIQWPKYEGGKKQVKRFDNEGNPVWQEPDDRG